MSDSFYYKISQTVCGWCVTHKSFILLTNEPDYVCLVRNAYEWRIILSNKPVCVCLVRYAYEWRVLLSNEPVVCVWCVTRMGHSF